MHSSQKDLNNKRDANTASAIFCTRDFYKLLNCSFTYIFLINQLSIGQTKLVGSKVHYFKNIYGNHSLFSGGKETFNSTYKTDFPNYYSKQKEKLSNSSQNNWHPSNLNNREQEVKNIKENLVKHNLVKLIALNEAKKKQRYSWNQSQSSFHSKNCSRTNFYCDSHDQKQTAIQMQLKNKIEQISKKNNQTCKEEQLNNNQNKNQQQCNDYTQIVQEPLKEPEKNDVESEINFEEKIAENTEDQKLKELLSFAKNDQYCACSRCTCGHCRCPYVINHPAIKILLPNQKLSVYQSDYLNKVKTNAKSDFNNLPLNQTAKYSYNYPKESIDEKSMKQEDYNKKHLETIPYLVRHPQKVQEDFGPFSGNSNYKQNFVAYNSRPIPNQKFPERSHQLQMSYSPQSTYMHSYQQIPLQSNLSSNKTSYLNYKMPAFGNNLPFLNQKTIYRGANLTRDSKYLPINQLYTNDKLTPYPGTYETLQSKDFKGLSEKFCPAKAKIADKVIRLQLLEEIQKQAEQINI